jgi:hypothetical protein
MAYVLPQLRDSRRVRRDTPGLFKSEKTLVTGLMREFGSGRDPAHENREPTWVYSSFSKPVVRAVLATVSV